MTVGEDLIRCNIIMLFILKTKRYLVLDDKDAHQREAIT